MPLQQYATSWLAHIKPHVRETTLESYVWAMDHALPALGHIRLQQLTRTHIKTCFRARPSGACGRRAPSRDASGKIERGTVARTVSGLELLTNCSRQCFWHSVRGTGRHRVGAL